MATPEGRIKQLVRRALREFPDIWVFMPVQRGFGIPALDFILCVPTALGGLFVVIETKADEAHRLTPRQEATKSAMEKAGAAVFIVSSEETLRPAVKHIRKYYLPDPIGHHTPPDYYDTPPGI